MPWSHLITGYLCAGAGMATGMRLKSSNDFDIIDATATILFWPLMVLFIGIVAAVDRFHSGGPHV